ncbi:hypothetical protein AB1Y20_006342 [Prymnesium parvum]|uniref:Uncharacterized protein n=1 Tax=Prymnesium parvum TaxID=97485 RepID=A0AB34J1Z9_PRYPA
MAPVPRVRLARKPDVSSDFWAPPLTSAAEIKGVGLKQWVSEVERTGIAFERAPEPCAARRSPVKIATGVMRPEDERPPPSPHSSTRGVVCAPARPVDPELRSPAEQVMARLPLLEQRLRAAGQERALPTEIIRATQSTLLPLDDHDVRATFKYCRPDRDGRLAVCDVINAIRYSQQLLIDKMRPSPFREEEPLIEPRFAAPLPAPMHAYKAADLPTPLSRGDRGKRAMQDRHITSDQQLLSTSNRGWYELLSSKADCHPHRSAIRQRRLLPASSGGMLEAKQALKLSLTIQDRTKRGVLPTTVVIQFLKLHGLWDSRSADEWDALFAQHQPPGPMHRVWYKHLLNAL